MYGLIGKMKCKPGERDALAAILIQGVAGMPGCLSYVVARDPTDTDALWITEAWVDQASHKASLSLPAVQQAIAKGRPLIAGFGDRHETEPLGGHGLATRSAPQPFAGADPHRHGTAASAQTSSCTNASDMPDDILYRPATPKDALTLSVLAAQVFLDTYATSGVNGDLAEEVSSVYSQGAFLQRLRNPGVEITVAAMSENLVAFLDLDSTSKCPVASVQGIEVLRLYVQSPFQRSGIGRALMTLAEGKARERNADKVWLTAWADNVRAIAFYMALGYRDVGATQYVVSGKAYENRVFAKPTAECAG